MLAGGAGDDILFGYGGSDTYVYNAGDGNDEILEGSSATGDVDKLALGAGLTSTNVIVTREIADSPT